MRYALARRISAAMNDDGLISPLNTSVVPVEEDSRQEAVNPTGRETESSAR